MDAIDLSIMLSEAIENKSWLRVSVSGNDLRLRPINFEVPNVLLEEAGARGEGFREFATGKSHISMDWVYRSIVLVCDIANGEDDQNNESQRIVFIDPALVGAIYEARNP